MIKIAPVLFVLAIFPAVALAQVQPLQPANQPEIFDFTGQVNDPAAPGNRDEDGVRNYPEISTEQEQPKPAAPQQAPATPALPLGVDGFSITAGVVIVLVSAAAAGGWYWYKTSRQPAP